MGTHRSVAVDAPDLDSRSRFVVEHPRTVSILPEVTVGAVHSFLKMNVLKVNRLSEFVGIGRRNYLVFRIKEISFPIFFIDLPEHPPVTVCVGELDALQLLVEEIGTGRLKKNRIRPQSAQGCAFGIYI